MKSPKEAFLLDPVRVDRSKKLLKDPDMETLIHTAYNQFCWGLPAADNPQSSWAANARRQGAQEALQILAALTDQITRPEKPTSGQLEREDARPKHTKS